MPSTATTRKRLEKMAAGEYDNAWAARMEILLDMLDMSGDGVLDLAVSGTVILTDADFTADQAKNRIINISGTGGQIAIPNRQIAYFIRNGSSGDVTITTGSGTTVAVPSGYIGWVFSTGSNVVYAQTHTTSGTNTPGIVTQSDVAIVAEEEQYMRVGNTVTVSGRLSANVAALGSVAYARLTVPVNSAFAASRQAGGTGITHSVNNQFRIDAYSANTIQLWFYAATTGNHVYSYTYTYRVV